MRISNALRMGSSVNTLTLATSVMKGVVPYHYLDFVGNSALEAGVSKGPVSAFTGYTFTRASGGYYENSDGTLTWFDSGVLRRGNRGVLIEGARTNLLQRSQEFENIYWSKTNVTITTSGDAPDGTPTARLCTVNTTAATNTVLTTANAVAITGTSCVATIFVKRGANVEPTGAFLLRDQTAGVNKITGTVTWATMTIVGVGASIQRLGTTDWYRITLLDTSWTSTNTAVLYFGTTGGSYTAGHSWYVWGAQIEATSFPSSYIPTTTASATRAADVLTFTAGVSYPLSLWVEAEFSGADSTYGSFGRAFLVAINGAADRTQLYNISSAFGSYVNANNVNQGSSAVSGTVPTNTVFKAANSVQTNSLKFAKNGTLGLEDTTVDLPKPPALIEFGGTAGYPYGYIHRAAIFNSALSGTDLQTVTT